MLERHADAACVTGQFRDDRGELLAAGEVFGYAGLTGSPIVHSQPRPSGYHGLLYCQRTVSVPTPWFFVARAGFIKAALAACSCSPSFEMLGCWLGAYARQSGQRILYSPFIRCRRRTAHLPLRISDAEVLHFLRQHRTLLEHDPTYGRFFSLKREEGYHLTESAQRERRLRETICRVRTERRPVEVCV
jgi:hypothetical protein